MRQTKIIVFLVVLIFSASFILYLYFKNRNQNPNIILITVDTLRADHLSSYGYQRATTPHIDQLAEDGTLFLHTIAQIPETLPSFCSIMTSSYPIDHGVRKNGYKLSTDKKTLAETLQDNGYTTAAFVSSCVLDSSTGIDRGFQFYDDTLQEDFLFLASCQRTAEKTTESAIRWIEGNAEKKFFLWVHFNDPHSLYDPPPPFDLKFSTQPHSSKMDIFIEKSGKMASNINLFFKIIRNRIRLNETAVQYMVDRYDGEIAFMDRQLGKLLEKFKEPGLKNTLIVFTADHGESLGEHNYFFDHGDFLYENQIKVPLIISHPKLPENQIVRNQVESVDIMPTIFDFIKVLTEANMRGRSLLPLLYDEDEIDFERFAFSESDICQENSIRPCSETGIKGKLYSLRTGKWKYILDKNGQSELYNLLEDPLEMQNLIDEEKELAGLLDAKIKSLIADKDDKGEQSLSEETKEKLKSLGYL
jgi:arylsulfatase A-like enzyme